MARCLIDQSRFVETGAFVYSDHATTHATAHATAHATESQYLPAWILLATSGCRLNETTWFGVI